MVNYQLGKIYKIVGNGLVYVGSTCEPNLARRLAGHVARHKHYLKGGKYYSSFEVLESGDYHIELVEQYPCDSKDELFTRERYQTNKIDCVNINKNQGLKLELGKKGYEKQYNDAYRAKNKEKINEHMKIYSAENRELINIKNKKYYETNKETLLSKNKEYHNKHKEKIKQYLKIYHKMYSEKNHDIIKEKKKEYQKKNMELIKSLRQKYYLQNKNKILLNAQYNYIKNKMYNTIQNGLDLIKQIDLIMK